MDYTTRFHAIEERLGLFADAGAGFLWWEAVRYDLHGLAYRRLTGLTVPAPTPPGLPQRLAGLLVRTGLKLGLWLQTSLLTHDVIVFRAARQVRHGQRHDPAIDPLTALCPGRRLVIDTHPHCYHRRVRVPAHAGLRAPPALEAFCDAVEAEFGIALDRQAIAALVVSRLAAFRQARAAYRKLFARVRPRFVLLSQNGIETGLFVAAREMGIPVVEAQHGLINHAHPAYSYPRSVRRNDVPGCPSHFLSFSDYWSRTCHYPVEQVLALGNDSFFVEPLPPAAPPGDVLFVSADLYHATLGPWLADVALRLPQRQFKYKLHPNQQADFETIRAQFASLPNVSVVGGSVPARQMLAAADVIVVVQSTVVHEALQAGRRVCILPVLNYQIHEDLFDLAAVSVTADSAALAHAIEAGACPAPAPAFFDRFDTVRARALLQRLFESPREAAAFDVAAERRGGEPAMHGSGQSPQP